MRKAGRRPMTRATTKALQAIVELDLEALADIAPPRGYGRD